MTDTQNQILEKLFRVQATLEHVTMIGRVDELELRYLRQALTLQEQAVKLVCLMGREQPTISETPTAEKIS